MNTKLHYATTVKEAAQKYRHERTTNDPVNLKVEYADEIAPYGYPKPNRPLEEPLVPWYNRFVWGWLQYRIHNKDVSDIHIGDWIPLKLRMKDNKTEWDNEYHYDNYSMEISAIGENYIDFISKELVPYKAAWDNVTHTNCGHTQNIPMPWVNHSLINHFLNTEIFGLLSGDFTDVKNVIIDKISTVDIKYLVHIPSDLKTPAKCNITETKTTKIGKLWLPSKIETFGNVIDDDDASEVQYETLNTPEKRIKKCVGENRSSIWSTLSIVNDSYDKIVGVGKHGEQCEISADTKVGFPICFRIG